MKAERRVWCGHYASWTHARVERGLWHGRYVNKYGVNRDPASTPAHGIDHVREELTRRTVERIPSWVRTVVNRLVDRDLVLTASSLAFYGLISVLPLLLLSFAAVRVFVGVEGLQTLENRAVSPQTGSAGLLVRDLIRGSQGTSWLIGIAALWPATAYGGALRRALRHISGGDESLPGLRGRMIGLGFVFVLPVLVLAGIPGSYAMTRLTGDGVVTSVLGWVVAFAVGAVVIAALLTLLYRVFAPERLDWRSTFEGALFTAVALSLLSLGSVVALGLMGAGNRYGNPAVSAMVLLGVWLLVVNMLILVGYATILELNRSITS